jgi:hypothetical protein
MAWMCQNCGDKQAYIRRRCPCCGVRLSNWPAQLIVSVAVGALFCLLLSAPGLSPVIRIIGYSVIGIAYASQLFVLWSDGRQQPNAAIRLGDHCGPRGLDMKRFWILVTLSSGCLLTGAVYFALGERELSITLFLLAACGCVLSGVAFLARRRLKHGCSGCLGIVSIVSIGVLLLAILSWPFHGLEYWARRPFRSFLQDYTEPREYSVLPPTILGKVLPIRTMHHHVDQATIEKALEGLHPETRARIEARLMANEEVTEFDFALWKTLPAELRASSVDEIGTVIDSRCAESEVFKYTDGATEHRYTCHVAIADWKSQSVLGAKKQFTGDLPTRSIADYVAALPRLSLKATKEERLAAARIPGAMPPPVIVVDRLSIDTSAMDLHMAAGVGYCEEVAKVAVFKEGGRRRYALIQVRHYDVMGHIMAALKRELIHNHLCTHTKQRASDVRPARWDSPSLLSLENSEMVSTEFCLRIPR